MPLKRPRIEIIPLIDVMFFLLAAFMMVSLSMQKAQTLPMDLPVAMHARDAFRPDALNLGVELDGRVSVGTQRVDLMQLDEILQNRFQSDPRASVFVTADRRTTQGAIHQVLDRVRRAGFQQISFVTASGTPASPINESESVEDLAE